MRFKDHSNHIDILKGFYYANKYILTEQMKDTILDAIECMEHVERNKEDNSNTAIPPSNPSEDSTYTQQELQQYIKEIWDREEYHTCPQCGGLGRVRTMFSEKTCPGCKGKGKLPFLIGVEGYPERIDV